MLGRHNITLYADEVERCMGKVKTMLDTQDMGLVESGYWLGVWNTLAAMYSPDMPDNHESFVARLLMHFEKEAPSD